MDREVRETTLQTEKITEKSRKIMTGKRITIRQKWGQKGLATSDISIVVTLCAVDDHAQK